MKYFGGKASHCKEIAAVIRSKSNWKQIYREPFCGACWVTQHIYTGPRFVSDIHKPLIQMWQALQRGWIPPDEVSEEEYNIAHELWKEGYENHLIGFMGFACSFGGKWFGGYARGDSNRNYAFEAKKSLLSKLQLLRDVKFECLNYRLINPNNEIIYCDPPYKGTTSYDNTSWCSNTFWITMREWSKNNTVIISEYQAPSDFRCIWQTEKHLSIRSNTDTHRLERLFQYDASSLK